MCSYPGRLITMVLSGVLKNFLDYYVNEFAVKIFGYLCASHEEGLTVMDQMRTVVRQCYGWTMPYGVSINGEQDFDLNGDIRNIYDCTTVRNARTRSGYLW
jgi:NAD(P)H-dependent FMN reductase